MTISHPDIWNHRCQATNLAGSSEQTTPVTVRHAGGSNVQSGISISIMTDAIGLPWNDCCAFMVSVLQWQRTTRPPVVQSTTTVWTEATALTTNPSASWSAGNAKWSDTVTFGNLLRWAKAQTNFIASYIHLDAHCLASSDELEPLEIYIHTQSVTSSG